MDAMGLPQSFLLGRKVNRIITRNGIILKHAFSSGTGIFHKDSGYAGPNRGACATARDQLPVTSDSGNLPGLLSSDFHAATSIP